ncbi:hypothetical protein M427DRAFT_39741 [Gonapodya prolifera JEL478]|uniref:Uncharacterized protein n=1 Tax=Gonapodya prolifera (strain JEL478) TaxID=1344416 RepID=A0A138ZWU3_GONPJ|nr:hypothetical protein M427DRAFT_39741 [Gonapodya prolifera JEL478]|eukprot:KXS08980.1 hypothetical protein M427DRAFT_39741 [Gonapodya prolifera JEL478]
MTRFLTVLLLATLVTSIVVPVLALEPCSYPIPLLGKWSLADPTPTAESAPPHIAFRAPESPSAVNELFVTLRGLIMNDAVNGVAGQVAVENLQGDEEKGWSGEVVVAGALISTEMAGDPSYRSPLTTFPLSFSLSPNPSVVGGYTLTLKDAEGNEAKLTRGSKGKTVVVEEGEY